jgi:glycosyltransferase
MLTCRYLPEVLVKMRVGGASNRSLRNILRKSTLRKSTEDYRALQANQVGGLATLIRKNLSKLPQFIGPPPGLIFLDSSGQ